MFWLWWKGGNLAAKLSIQLCESYVYLTHILSVSLFYFFLKRKLQRFIWKDLKIMYIIYVYIYCKHVLNVSSKGRLHGCILMF